MLIKSERNTSHDLKLWKELEEADGIRAADLKQSKIDQAIIDIQGIAKEVCYVSVSWGKDSVVLAHLCVCAGIDVPFIWIVEKPFFNPDCLPVRDAFLKRFSIRYYEYEIEYTPDNMYSPKPFKEKGDYLFEEFGRRITGIRMQESNTRKIRYFVHGITSKKTAAPLSLWKTWEIFAYLKKHDLPTHPAYAMLGGGRYERDHIRVDAIGGIDQYFYDWENWEREYYHDVLNRLRKV
ncbi:phosphoadenosine phosphosulfate reductase domain-containing protein [Sediminispirochaeta smaragdinae]|uniref:Phosphoadenosine phosphosulfate reductase n=1 Tax=Sediminispirochaeta smaragdinae (strain DSM 11293 / JCM 15392 / SEBR 4228) TaxID=573413 RepID=E1R3I4_SEDSS|nr:phosphoadenosine phosphosulfate reductase family protein [Sediminispirochaeta smaragdinae]ADK81615.1 phosphoadenosine phosphosulfate reductase [Sediminispirochaeta smaragdinae DSM 11293]